jgi:hypothetical protein
MLLYELSMHIFSCCTHICLTYGNLKAYHSADLDLQATSKNIFILPLLIVWLLKRGRGKVARGF